MCKQGRQNGGLGFLYKLKLGYVDPKSSVTWRWIWRWIKRTSELLWCMGEQTVLAPVKIKRVDSKNINREAHYTLVSSLCCMVSVIISLKARMRTPTQWQTRNQTHINRMLQVCIPILQAPSQQVRGWETNLGLTTRWKSLFPKIQTPTTETNPLLSIQFWHLSLAFPTESESIHSTKSLQNSCVAYLHSYKAKPILSSIML